MSDTPGVVERWRDEGGGLGLALGGGGALGAAHVGVLEVLEEHGVFPWVVVGTSAGALIGGAYAAGMNPCDIRELALHADWATFAAVTIKPKLGVLDASGLLATIEKLGGDRLIEDLPVHFGAVATDVKLRQSVVLDRGSIGTALSASMAVPGLFPPVKRDGRWLVDGGVTANLPIQAALDLGATHVIGVRIQPEWDAIPGHNFGPAIARLERRSTVTMIRPDVAGFAQWSARDVPDLIRLGRQAAEAVIAGVAVAKRRKHP